MNKTYFLKYIILIKFMFILVLLRQFFYEIDLEMLFCTPSLSILITLLKWFESVQIRQITSYARLL